MRFITTVLLLVIAANADAQIVVRAIDDRLIAFTCLSFESYQTEAISFGGDINTHYRSVIVFDKLQFPESSATVLLEITALAEWQYAKLFQISACSSPSDAIAPDEWEDQLDRLIHVGVFEIPAVSGRVLCQYDITNAIARLTAEPGRYIHLKLASTRLICRDGWCNGSFAGIRYGNDVPGPQLRFAQPVSSGMSSMGRLKSMFR